MAVQTAPVRLASLRSGPHKPTEEVQAAQQFQYLLQVTDKHWQSITAWCVTPWIPEHELLQAEAPPEVAGLHIQVAAMHSKCMQSQRFMVALQREAAGMTARQVEQLQVLLYALEDFSFADFIHLAVYHRRDMFAASPVGISARIWNPNSFLNPVLTTPHQRLSDPDFPARNLRASRASRRGPDLISAAQLDGGNNGENADEAERLRCVEIPEMVKWATLLENGGLPRKVPAKQPRLGMGALAGLTRLKRRATIARKTLALRLPPKVVGDDEGQGPGGRDLSVAICRTQQAVLQSWDDKVFPGEGKGSESARDSTFTGLRDITQRYRSALTKDGVTSNRASFSSHPFVAPLHSHQSLSDSTPPAQQPVNSSSHSHNAASVPAASDIHMLAADQQHQTEQPEVLAEATDDLRGSSSMKSASISPALGAAPSIPGMEAESELQGHSNVHSEVQMSQVELPQQLPSPPDFADSTDGNVLANAASGIKQSQHSGTTNAAEAADVDDAQDPSSVDRASCLDGAEQQDEHHLELPGRFSEAQFVLLQRRQHQLQSQRMAGLPLASKSQPSILAQLEQQALLLRPQDSSLSERVSSEQQSRASSPFRPLPQHVQHTQHAQRGAVDGEEVANSPVVLFSPGGPYSHNSSWYKDSAATQGPGLFPRTIAGSHTTGLAVTSRAARVPPLGLPPTSGPAGQSGTPLGLFSRPGSGADIFADATAISAASQRSAASRRGHESRHPSGTDVLAGANTPGLSNRSSVNTKAISRHVSSEVLVPGLGVLGTAGRRGILSRHLSGIDALADATMIGVLKKGGVLRGALSKHSSAEGLTPAVSNKKPYSSSAASSRPEASDRGAASDRQQSAADIDAASAEGMTEAADKKGSASVSNTAEEQQSSHPVKTGSQYQQHNNQPFDLANVTEETVMLPSLVEPLVRLPAHKSALKSAASLYAASGVVDDLFTPKETYMNVGAEPMTRARHHYSLSPRQIEEDSEKRKEFASNLGAWYKAQLQRRARVNTSGARVMSRSNSKLSD
ncbi:hypothetical protein WJX77_001634 [Trebouxia sp. C0004]